MEVIKEKDDDEVEEEGEHEIGDDVQSRVFVKCQTSISLGGIFLLLESYPISCVLIFANMIRVTFLNMHQL